MLFLLIVFLFPVAIYCGILATINRREHPLLISGTWDTAGLLFACSGFLLVAGPAILTVFYHRVERGFLVRGGGAEVPSALMEMLAHWGLYWSLYYGAVIFGSIAMLWLRRNSTVIYNIDIHSFESAFNAVLDGRRQPWIQRGKRILLGEAPSGQATAEAVAVGEPDGAFTAARSDSRSSNYMNLEQVNPASSVTVHVFPSLYNVTLHWHRGIDPETRDEIEHELVKSFENVYTQDNPASGWLLGVSSGLFLLMVFSMVMVFIFTLFLRGR